LEIMKKLSSRDGFERTMESDWPSIISMSSAMFLLSSSLSASRMSCSLVASLISRIVYFLDLRPADMAMHLAVSILSPVSIHTYMPALLSVSIVERTSS
jgi:hypothetical protein